MVTLSNSDLTKIIPLLDKIINIDTIEKNNSSTKEYPITKQSITKEKKKELKNIVKKIYSIINQDMVNNNISNDNFYRKTLKNITGGNNSPDTEEKAKKEIFNKIDKLNKMNDKVFNDPIIIMSLIILSNKINNEELLEDIFISIDNLKLFFVDIQDIANIGDNISLLDDIFESDNHNIKNYNILDNYRNVRKNINLTDIINRDSVYGNKLYNTSGQKYIFIYTLIKILYFEYDNFIKKITIKNIYQSQWLKLVNQSTTNLQNGISKLNFNKDTITEAYKTIVKEEEPKLLTLLRFRHDMKNNDFNHRFGITKASDYEKDVHQPFNHINNFLDDMNVGNNNNIIFNYLNINEPKQFNVDSAIEFNKLANMKKLYTKHGYEKYTATFNSIYNPYISLKTISNKDPNITRLKNLLNNNNNKVNMIIMGLGQSGVGKTSFLLGYEYNGLNEGIVDQLININDVKQVSVKEYFLDKDKRPIVKESGPIGKDTLISYADTDELKKKIGLLLLKFLEGGLNITNEKHIVNKKVRSTPNNKKSSRSHAVIIVELNSKSNLIICDLAGVENKFNCNNITIINFFKKIQELYNKKNKNNNLSFYNFVLSYDWFRPLNISNSSNLETTYNNNYDLINKNLEKIEDGLRISDTEISKMEEEYTIKKITKNFLENKQSKKYKPSKNNFNKIKNYLSEFTLKYTDSTILDRINLKYPSVPNKFKFLQKALPPYDKEDINYDKLNLGDKELNEINNNIVTLKSKRDNARNIINSTLWKHITIICNFSTAEGTKIINKELQDLEKDLISQVINSGKIKIGNELVNPIYRNSTSFDCYKLSKEKYELFYDSENNKDYNSKIFSSFLPKNDNQNIIVLSTVFDLRIHDFSKLPRNFPPPVPYISLKPFIKDNKSKTDIVKDILKELEKHEGYLPDNIRKEITRTDNSYMTIIKYIESLNSITAIGVIETVSKIKNLFFCSDKIKPSTKGGYYYKYLKYKQKYINFKKSL